MLWSEVDEASADAEIERALARLRAGGGELEWKLYGHDGPEDLPRRLVAAGLEPDEQEAVLVADLAALELEPVLPDGVELRVATSAEVAHFGEVGATLARALERQPPPALGVLCLAGGEPVSSARIEFNEGTDFAGLWGGETVPEWRGRGLYRATVALRARLARERGYRYLQVDALPTSAPILRRLGFVQLTTTTPYTPAAGADGRAAAPPPGNA